MTFNEFIILISFVGTTVTLANVYISSNKFVSVVVGVIAILVYVLAKMLHSYIQKKSSSWINIFMYKIQRCADPYLIHSKNIEYIYKDINNLELEKKYCLIARDTISSFTDRYSWSGIESNTEILPLFEGDRITGKREMISWNYFNIELKKTYFKNEKINTGIRIENLHDPNRICKPFLLVSIEEKTKYLNLVVKIPKELCPKNAKFLIFSTFNNCRTPNNGENGEELHYNNTIQGYSVKINYPRKGWKYAITWEFNE